MAAKTPSTDMMSPRKALASSKSPGTFGVCPFPGSSATHPDVGMSHEALADSARSPAYQGMQGAADHGIGKGAKDSFSRAGKA